MVRDEEGELLAPEEAEREAAAEHVPQADDLEKYGVLEAADARVKSLGVAPLATGADRWISRQAWGARPPRSRIALRYPKGNSAHYEGPAMGEYGHETCAAKARAIQRFHMDTRGWSDVAYSTLICRHGYIYECRGYGVRTAANGTDAGNDVSFAHCVMIGLGDPFPDVAKEALREAFQEYERRGSGNQRWTHDQWKATACPGGPVRDYVRAGLPPVARPEPPRPEPSQPKDDDEFRRKVMALPVLREGANGHHVRILQALLIAHAEDLVPNANAFVDGAFGASTTRVLRTWQGRTGSLQADGVCGPATWAWLVGI